MFTMWLCEGLRSEVMMLESQQISVFQNYYINRPPPAPTRLALFSPPNTMSS